MSRRGAIPDTAFAMQFRVRSYEVGQSGTIGVSTALRYCEAIATEDSAAKGFPRAWYEAHHTAWVVRDMNILLGTLPQIGDELRLTTWVSEYKRVQAQREYAITHVATGNMVARASARWAYFDVERGLLARIPEEILLALQPQKPLLQTHHMAASHNQLVPDASSQWTLQARAYESDVQQHINNCVYVDWLTEAFHDAWGATQHVSDPQLLRPRFYHIEYLREALAGDTLLIETQLNRQQSRGLQAQQQIVRANDGTPIVRAYAQHLPIQKR